MVNNETLSYVPSKPPQAEIALHLVILIVSQCWIILVLTMASAISVVDLIGFIISMDTNLWAYL